LSNDLSSIGGSAFFGCNGIKQIDIPYSVEQIGANAFAGCQTLEEVVIGNGDKHINGSAFKDCEKLHTVTLNCDSIGRWFADKNTIVELKLGTDVSIISQNAFYGCSSLTDVYTSATTPPVLDASAFSSATYKRATLHVHAGTVEAYATAENWKRFFNISEDNTDSIEELQQEEPIHSGIYDLNGRKIQHPSKGIYIIGGRKVIVR
jgi:hypothetical protein